MNQIVTCYGKLIGSYDDTDGQIRVTSVEDGVTREELLQILIETWKELAASQKKANEYLEKWMFEGFEQARPGRRGL